MTPTHTPTPDPTQSLTAPAKTRLPSGPRAAGKESACSTGDLGSIPGLGRSAGQGKGYPLQYPGLETSMDFPWGRKESDTTEQLSLHSTCVLGRSGLKFIPRLAGPWIQPNLSALLPL